MPQTSHNVILSATEKYHNLCGAIEFTICDNKEMQERDDKNGGPNYLRAWREFRHMSQAELAEAVGTNQNMIGYLESGERGLSAKWLRRLAPALKTQPGFILEHDPSTLPTDIIEIWVNASAEERKQLISVAQALVRKNGTVG
ncbi:XRE family transcriptional regulator [Altericroceibacterium spongiae]|uniref:XRE family transcriptional regulator n=1 Tax=Altericroceibacterium spongiae TaxID=2320269 RepID=A0A420ERP5_9SPHN|nr:helix-turn-helix transcriptional regulator [Altericroceibacterium spongiae]RKF23355.1 XRE family transcriptional regulator [Altericroceibacterium spongiae]